MGGSSSGLSSLDTRTRLGVPRRRCAAVHALWTAPGAAAPPFCAVSALPQPACEVGPLGGHRAPSAGKTQHLTQVIRVAAPGATPRRVLDRPRAVPPGRDEPRRILDHPHPAQDASPSCESGVLPPSGRRTRRGRFPQLRKRYSHTRGSVALRAHGSGAFSAPATDRIGGRQQPGSSRASPGHNHLLGEAICLPQCAVSHPNARARAGRGTPWAITLAQCADRAATASPVPPRVGALDERTVE